MKIKPIYIYGPVIIIAVLFLIFSTRQNNSNSAESSPNTENQQMPNDDIHKNLDNPMTETPTKDNVSANVTHQMEMLKKEVEKSPNDTTKLKEYADFLSAAHQPEKAIPYYEQILNKDPKRTDILFSLTFIYYNQKDLGKAEEMTNKILSYDKNNEQALYNLGAIEATKGNKEKARQIWTDLINQDPNSQTSQMAENALKSL